MVTLDLPPDAETRLAELAERNGKSPAAFASAILLDHLRASPSGSSAAEQPDRRERDGQPSASDDVLVRVRALTAPFRRSGRSAVDELIGNRRAEAARETTAAGRRQGD